MHISVPEMISTMNEGKHADKPFHVLYDSILCNGDDPLDAFQGFFWMMDNRFLFDKPHALTFSCNVPVIACGSGPSLQDNLKRIKSLQGSCAIVCAESTAAILARHGIMPHVVTPTERIDQRARCMDAVLDKALFAGLQCVPKTPHRFKHHCLVSGQNMLSHWAGCACPYPIMPNSGLQAAATGAMFTRQSKQPVYCVGYDSCVVSDQHHADGHWDPNAPSMDMKVACVDGEQRLSRVQWWRGKTVLGQLAEMHKNLVYVTKHGAKIDNIQRGELPKTLPKCSKPILGGAHIHHNTDRVCGLLARLPQDLHNAKSRAMFADHLEQMSANALCDSDNKILLNYLLISIMAQFSILAHLGYDQKDLLEWMREAVVNTISGMEPLVEGLL